MKRTLNEIASNLRGLLYVLEDNAGEMDDDLETQLDEVEAELSDKINAMLLMCDDMTAKASVYKDRAAAFTAAQKALESNVKRVKHWVIVNMQIANMPSCETSSYPKVALRSSVAVSIDPVAFTAADHDASLWTIKPAPAPTPNKKAIKAAIKDGQPVAGASLQQNWNLNYKVATND